MGIGVVIRHQHLHLILLMLLQLHHMFDFQRCQKLDILLLDGQFQKHNEHIIILMVH